MDKATVAGIAVSFGGITAGLLLEGGKLSQILQPTAALIVAGGTVGAVLLQFPLSTVIAAARHLRIVFFEPRSRASDEIIRLTKLAQMARREGIISLDAELPRIDNGFLRRALTLAVDGTESGELRAIMQLELDASAEAEDELPRVYEAAGGFAPTIGIIGAVLGLIQVMQHLDKIDEVGRGIAVAFVATVYGVGFANLCALPIAGKLRHRLRFRQILRELTLEGVVSILEGINPRMLEAKLNGFLQQARKTRLQLQGRAKIQKAACVSQMKKRPKQNGNHERWLVSYADFMTLLFAFFVVLYSSAQVDKARMSSLSNAITNGFQELGVGSGPGSTAVLSGVVPADATHRPGESAEVIRYKLELGLSDELQHETVSLRDTREGLVLSLREVGFFESGSATLRANSMDAFDRIGSVLTSVASNLRIEGHTDNVPIHTPHFNSNWELSTARATEVIRLLLTREGIDPNRLSAAGYAEYHPIADNSTEDGRRLNRRVDIVIIVPHQTASPPQPQNTPVPAPQSLVPLQP